MSNLINIMDKSPLKYITKKINGEKVIIKTYLDMADFFNAVHTVADNCFVVDEESGEIIYKPEFYEVSWRYVVLKYFTDIEVDDISLAEVFKMTQANWYKEIEGALIDNLIYYEVNKAAERVISYRLSTQKSSFDKLCDNISAFLESNSSDSLADVKEVLAGLEKVDKQAFVDAVINRNLAQNKGGEKNGGKQSQGAIDKTRA